jgi:hypothetical protein
VREKKRDEATLLPFSSKRISVFAIKIVEQSPFNRTGIKRNKKIISRKWKKVDELL